MKRHSSLSLLMCLVPLLIPSAARAQVRDDAKFFKPETVKKVNEDAARIKKRFKKDLIVETIREIPAAWKAKYKPNKKSEFFMTFLAARAKDKKLDGVYLLLCRRPIWVQLGADKVTEKKYFSKPVQDRILDIVQKKFGKDQFDAGLLELTATIESLFAGEFREREGGGSPREAEDRQRRKPLH